MAELDMTAPAPRVVIYPAIQRDGIGTYVRNLAVWLDVDLVPPRAGIFSLVEFFRPLPQGYDVVHVPHCVVPLRKGRAKVICSIHDVTPLIDRELGFLKRAYLRFRIWWSIKRSDRLLFVSENALQETERIFGRIPQAKVIHHGSEFSKGWIEAIRPEYPFSYVFSVGRRRRHKNIEGVLRAFARAAHDSSLHLVFAGKEDVYDARWKSLASMLGIADRVHFAGYLTVESLAGHYREATCLLFASFHEGFGLPILEAMSQGCPVVTSNTSSMPEVAGNAALLVDPRDTVAMADAILRIHRDANLRQDLRKRGLLRAEEFSWSRAAAATLAEYKSILHDVR